MGCSEVPFILKLYGDQGRAAGFELFSEQLVHVMHDGYLFYKYVITSVKVTRSFEEIFEVLP